MFALRMMLAAALTALCCPMSAHGAEPANPDLAPEARRLLAYLERVYQHKTLSGYNVYVHTPDDYQQTARHAAVWGRDVRWVRRVREIAAEDKREGHIVTLHWHWFFAGESAWRGRRKKPADVGRIVTPGTPEHQTARNEMAAVADKLQVYRDLHVPVLWRPLHEIDGGWFWWTDKRQPENTAKLWRMMFDYFTRERKLNNLIWVYSAGVGDLKKKPVEYRKRFYPGPQYVDIAGMDVYGVDVKTDTKKYQMYFEVMSKVCPGKMLALPECDAIPDPDKMQRGATPRWLYAMPWWGCPSPRRSVPWASFTMAHDFIITLDELPALGPDKVAPQVGILSPKDDGSARFLKRAVTITAYATDRDGQIRRVEFFAGKQRIGTVEKPPYSFTWKDAVADGYDITAVAEDNDGLRSTSNRVRLLVGMKDLAKGKRAFASAGKSPEKAVDGNYYTYWWPGRKTDDEWIAVDLGQPREISRVNLLWGWKIHAVRYTIDVALDQPKKADSWTTVYKASGLRWTKWKATFRVAFKPVRARYVRLHALQRPRNQTWGGYQLAEFEIPVPVSEASAE